MPLSPHMRLKLLGGWRIEVSGISWDISSPTERALLLMLGLARDAGVHARTLIEGAWGRYWDLSNDHDSLHHAVSRLRRMLGDTEHNILVNYSRDWYRLDVGRATLDVTRFLDHYTRSRRLLLAAGRKRVTHLVRHAMCHQVAALQLWSAGSLADAMPQGTDPRAVRRNAERLDEQRRELLAEYAPLAARHGLHPDIPVHQLVPDMLDLGLTVSPGMLRDLMRDCDASTVDDLVHRLSRLSARNEAARGLVIEALLARQ